MGRPKGSWSGVNNPRWKGGQRIDRNGYISLKNPEHPNATKDGYVREHTLIMSNFIGRPIKPDETVHHINGITNDNRLENLIIMKRKSHTSLHHKGLIKPNSINNLKPMTKDIAKKWKGVRRSQPKICECCNKQFYRRGKPKSKHTYCSYKCSNKINNNINKFNFH